MYLAAAFLVGLGVFFATTQIYGIPIWWVFHGVTLSEVSVTGTLNVNISPNNPTQLGEHEAVVVVDASTQQPLEGVSLTVYYGGGPVFSTSTNAQGQAGFSFAGSPTIVDLERSGYSSVMSVLPNAPEQWVNGTYISALTGTFTGLVSLAGLLLQWRTRQHPSKRPRRSKRP